MKVLTKLSYLFVCILVLIFKPTDGCESKDVVDPNTASLITKNGFIDVSIKGNNVILKVAKIYDTPIQTVLRTKIGDKLMTPQLYDCGTYQICISDIDNKLNHTIIEAMPNSEVIKISRIVSNAEASLIDCYELKQDTQWVGGPQWRYQHWPIQHMYFDEEPYIPSHQQNMGLAERYWLSSKGMYILVSEKDPLFLDQNNYKDNGLCLVSKNKKAYRTRTDITLNYEIGLFKDSRAAHEYVVKTHFGKPTGHPDERMVQHPIWSTWARYKVNINETIITQFADEIISNGYKNSQLEIDDNWETCYGSAIFDTKKFRNISELNAELKRKGFRVTLWIHPFINEDCTEAFHYALKNGYFVKSVDGELHMTWWQGEAGAGAIDFTNEQAVEWWVSRLKEIQKLGIDSFKFDAGESSWLPQIPSLNGPKEDQPGIYTKSYVSALVKNFDSLIEARVAYRSQNLPLFTRMLDKDSTWGFNNGIPTLITTLLQMNLNGYSFVLPDMVGGNGYADNPLASSQLPSKELFVRWLQANVFMPSIQYSFVPWDYDNETNAICKKFTELHATITPTIISLMKSAVESGAPVNPPIWWVDPANPEAHEIKDEFLLGEEYLVAPVIEEGAVTRDIYLPRGNWKDANRKTTHKGPIWIKDYPAPLDVLPYFIRSA